MSRPKLHARRASGIQNCIALNHTKISTFTLERSGRILYIGLDIDLNLRPTLLTGGLLSVLVGHKSNYKTYPNKNKRQKLFL